MDVILKIGIEGLIFTILGEKNAGGGWRYEIEVDEHTDALFSGPEDDFVPSNISYLSAGSWEEALDLLNRTQRDWFRFRLMSIHPDFKDKVRDGVLRYGGPNDLLAWEPKIKRA